MSFGFVPDIRSWLTDPVKVDWLKQQPAVTPDSQQKFLASGNPADLVYTGTTVGGQPLTYTPGLPPTAGGAPGAGAATGTPTLASRRVLGMAPTTAILVGGAVLAAAVFLATRRRP